MILYSIGILILLYLRVLMLGLKKSRKKRTRAFLISASATPVIYAYKGSSFLGYSKWALRCCRSAAAPYNLLCAFREGGRVMLPLLRQMVLLSCSMLRLLWHHLNVGTILSSSRFAHDIHCTPRMIYLRCVEVLLLLRRTGRVLIQASSASFKSIFAPQLGQ